MVLERVANAFDQMPYMGLAVLAFSTASRSGAAITYPPLFCGSGWIFMAPWLGKAQARVISQALCLSLNIDNNPCLNVKFRPSIGVAITKFTSRIKKVANM
ncbi:hypothetical protein D3C78_1496930 [compost metagenome]